MSIKEEILSRKRNSELEGAILIRTQKNRAIGFIVIILLLSLISFWHNVESEAAPYLFALFCAWMLHYFIYYVLLLNINTNKKLEDVELYAEHLRAYSVEHIDRLTESCSKFDLSLKVGDYKKPPNEDIQHPKNSESASSIERNSLLKILLGVALTRYSYDPKAARSRVPGFIVSDLASFGINITDDTVLRHLKSAANNIAYVIPTKST